MNISKSTLDLLQKYIFIFWRINSFLILQHKTMQMMYETIYKALVEVGLEDSFTPQDFLNFFCLGNREAIDMYEPPSGNSHAANTPQVSFFFINPSFWTPLTTNNTYAISFCRLRVGKVDGSWFTFTQKAWSWTMNT